MRVLSGIGVDSIASSSNLDGLAEELKASDLEYSKLQMPRQSESLESRVHDRKVRDSALAWALKTSFVDEKFDIILVPGLRPAHAVAGDTKMTGKYVVALDETDENSLLNEKFSVKFLRRVVENSALIIGTPQALQILVQFSGTGHDKAVTYSVDDAYSMKPPLRRLSNSMAIVPRMRVLSAATKTVLFTESAPLPFPQVWPSQLTTPSIMVNVGSRSNTSSELKVLDDLRSNVVSVDSQIIPKYYRKFAYQLKLLCGDINANSLLVDSPVLAKYCVNHHQLRKLTSIFVHEDNLDLFLSSSPRSFSSTLLKARGITAANEGIRMELERQCPELIGRVSIWQEGSPFVNYGMKEIQKIHDPKRLLVASHDFKFVNAILRSMEFEDNLEIRKDQWPAQHLHDEVQSQIGSEWANVVWCEFASRNAVWFSNNKLPGQKLIVRMHGYEIEGPWLEGVAYGQVDQWVFVSALLRDEACARLPIDPARCVVIPNGVNVDILRRAKYADAKFHLGLVGVVPTIKRADRALDVLRDLRSVDDRYTLHIKSRFPYDVHWLWQDPQIRDVYEAFFERIRKDPLLKHGVAFSSFSSGMPHWYRRVGWLLSPSTRESFHLAPVEGMASGAVPVVWNRPGAAEVFPEDSIFDSTTDIVNMILRTNDSSGGFEEKKAKSFLKVERYDFTRVIPKIHSLIVG